MKTTMTVAVVLTVVLTGAWFALSKTTDEPMPAATQPDPTGTALAEVPTTPPSESKQPEVVKTRPNGPQFEPVPLMNRAARAAEAQAANLAMNERHDEAREAIFKAVAHSGTPAPLHNFIDNWYAEVGREEIGLPLLLLAQRMGVKWADAQINVMARKFNKEELAAIEQEVARLEQQYHEIYSEIAGGRS